MGLAAPLALLGLTLVGVPVLAHLLRRADVRVLRLPTVALLARAAVESRRRPRIVDPLLLALRILAVALAVLALSAPFTERELSFGDGRVASVIVVIDDSMSMSRMEGDASLLSLAQARAAEIIDSLPEGSEVGLVGAGSPARVVRVRTSELASVLDDLRRERLSEGTARGEDLVRALSLAQRQLAGARHSSRRIVVLSDLRGADPLAGEALPNEDVTFERIGSEDALSNLAITQASVEVRESSRRVAFTVRAFGAGSPTQVTARLLRGATELGRGEVTLDGGSGTGVLEVADLALENDPGATLVITTPSGDAFAADDRRGVLLRPPSAPRVVLVDRLASGEPSSRFLERALTLAPREAGGPIAVRRIDARTLGDLEVGTADVIITVDVDLRDTHVAEALRAHVDDGAGLLVVVGPHAGAGTTARIDDLLPGRITSEGGPVDGLIREPASSLLPPGAAPDAALAGVRVRRRASLEVSDGEVALRFSDGTPAMIFGAEHRAAILGVPVDESWSDLPFRPVFLPMMVRSVVGLSRPGTMPDEPFAAGAITTLRGPSDARAADLSGPGGVVTERDLVRGAMSLDGLSDAGAYAVTFRLVDGRSVTSPRSAFVLAAPASESDPAVFAAPESTSEARTSRSAPALVRTSLAPWLFLLVGLACLAEGALRIRRRAEDGDRRAIPVR